MCGNDGEEGGMAVFATANEESAPPPFIPGRRFPGTLPSPVSSLIGRERDAEIVAGLLRDGARLVTLTGPGGVGKTRLAIEAAHRLAADFPHAVSFVPLAAVRDPALVLPAVARTLGLPEAADRDAAAVLIRDLRDERLLLLLDNLEQVIEVAPAIAALLDACPRLAILATSRELLRLGHEREISVSPLDTTDEAIELFAERALRTQPNFALSDENRPLIAAICARLDGLPLAIELAAARLRHLSPAALLARLTDRLRLLTAGPRDLPERQQTLRSTIAWSYDLLTPPDRELFRRCAVFSGGFSLEAAERIGGENAVAGLASLIDKSLLLLIERGGAPRYLMLETIHDFGLELLTEHGEEYELRREHAAWALELAAGAEAALTGPGRVEHLKELEREHANLREALRWTESAGEYDTGLRLATALWRFWEAQGHLNEGRATLERLLAATSGQETVSRARALRGAAGLAHRQGDFLRGAELANESLSLAQALQNRPAEADALIACGDVSYTRQDAPTAVTFFDRALALFRVMGNDDGIAMALTRLGMALTVTGDLDRANAVLEEALAISRRRDFPFWDLVASGRLAFVAHRQGELALAESRLESVLPRQRREYPRAVADSLWDLAAVTRDQGRYARAASLLAEALTLRWERGERRATAETIASIAELAALTGRWEPAAILLGTAEGIRTTLSVAEHWWERPRRERALAAAQTALGEDATRALRERGRLAPLDDAVGLARQTAAKIAADPAPALPVVPAADHGLTARELEVLRLLAAGLADKEIADRLFISPRTVARHLQSIYGKLQLSGRTAATAYAHRHGLT
jgi:non-specific serine/threonine protein kinase